MAFLPPAQYFNRFDAAKNYEQHLFLAGTVMQSAEFNELQSALQDRLQRVADALFSDGAVIEGTGIIVDPVTGVCQCPSSRIYLRGAVRSVPAATFTVATSGRVQVGVYLQEDVVTALDDPTLRDPATGVRNYQQPGAARLRVAPCWGTDTSALEGEFFPIHTISDGTVDSKDPPPAVDAIATALSRYDRQSSGGYYVVSGLTLIRLADLDGHQIYTLRDGVARVNGEEVVKQHATRIVYAAVPDTKHVSLEPHMATGGVERITVNHGPIVAIESISLTRQETITLTHGSYSGVKDPLPNSPVAKLVTVKQAARIYTAGVDYRLTDDTVDWSLSGAEPAVGSSYEVTYQYIATVEPLTQNATSVEVSGAVADTLVQITYTWAMPRIDRLAINGDGEPVWIKGTASPFVPRAPGLPPGLLGIASVFQRWTAETTLTADGITMVPMSELNLMSARIDRLFALVAEERLALNLTIADPTAKKGIFTDAFYDDDMRDQGIDQTTAIFNQELTLGVAAVVQSQSLDEVQTLDARVTTETIETVGPAEAVIQQLLRTGSMAINPYASFSAMPGVALLAPAVDYWTDFQTQWLSPLTRQFEETTYSNPGEARLGLDWAAANGYTGAALERFIDLHTTVINTEMAVSTEVAKVGTKYVNLQYLRQIPVGFSLSGFGAGEHLKTVTFDGVSVPFAAG